MAAVARATGGAGLRSILVTQAHPDHAGGLQALRSVWNPAISCYRQDLPFVTGHVQYRQLPGRHLTYAIGRHFLGNADWQLPVARDLEAGQSAEGMSVIHLPGHSPGQIGFLHPVDNAMLCGDALGNNTGRLRAPSAVVTWDPTLAEQLIARLGELDFELLLPMGRPSWKRDAKQCSSTLVAPATSRMVGDSRVSDSVRSV